MKTPLHLWLIGAVALLWNAGGAFDYVMTQTDNTAYLDQLPEAGLAMLEARPWWFNVTWAFGVWGAVAGSLLLLLRSRFAEAAFAIAILGFAGSAVWSYGLSEVSAAEVMGPVGTLMSAAIGVSLILLWLYSRAMSRRGVLR